MRESDLRRDDPGVQVESVVEMMRESELGEVGGRSKCCAHDVPIGTQGVCYHAPLPNASCSKGVMLPVMRRPTPIGTDFMVLPVH